MFNSIVHLPWGELSAMVAFFIGITVLTSKWVPGVKQIVASVVRWLGDAFTASTNERLDSVITTLTNHINDTKAHNYHRQEEDAV